MRIIEWNCQGAFRNKYERILALRPDIMIIPECEPEDKLKFGKLIPMPTDFFWYSNNESKGIGIFSYSDYKFELLKEFNPRFSYIIPLKVSNDRNCFILFAIWAKDNKEDPRARYIAQIWLALDYYSHLLNMKPVLIGDFNSNQIWDDKSRLGNHSDVVDILRQNQILSLYHEQNALEHGKEEDHTFFMHRKIEKPYHIDYCFASNQYVNQGAKIQLGNPEEWIDISDHIPLIVDINISSCNFDFENSLHDFVTKKSESFNPVTIEKFNSEIAMLREKAIELDDKESENEDRLLLIATVERLMEIDKSIVSMKKDGY